MLVLYQARRNDDITRYYLQVGVPVFKRVFSFSPAINSSQLQSRISMTRRIEFTTGTRTCTRMRCDQVPMMSVMRSGISIHPVMRGIIGWSQCEFLTKEETIGISIPTYRIPTHIRKSIPKSGVQNLESQMLQQLRSHAQPQVGSWYTSTRKSFWWQVL